MKHAGKNGVIVLKMAEPPLRADDTLDTQPLMGVRNLHNFIYCPRLFYYQWVENIFQENADTIKGSEIHGQIDRPSRVPESNEFKAPEGKTLRSLKLQSESMGLIGVIDLLEGGESGPEIIDYKKGGAWRDERGNRIAKEPDIIQTAAHALLLKEHGIEVSGAAVYYAEDKRRVSVELNEGLYDKCRSAITEAKRVAASGVCPPPLKDDPRCLYCSAYPVCLPNESAFWTDGGEPRNIEQPPRPENDEGEVLIVQTAGAQVGHRGGHFIVTSKGENLQQLSDRQVRTIYLYGAVQLTAQAAQACLESGVDVAYFSPSGRFLGLLRGLPASGVDARLGQYRMFGEEGLRLKLAREVIRCKIHNQRVMLIRNGEAGQGVIDELARLRDQASRASSLTALLGIEGMAAARYFENFHTMLKTTLQEEFHFSSRNRRPPRDPVNALLSMGYSMLCKETAGVCHAVGLDPFLGFLHQPRYGRPALALDLMEEFRPLIADSVAVSLLNRGEIDAKDFMYTTSGVFMNEHGRRAFWESYSRRMDSEVSHPQFGYKMQYRRMLDVQARQLWRFVRGEAGQYHGFTTR